MPDPADIRKYNFITMPVKEQWSLFVQKSPSRFAWDRVRPKDLVGMSLVSAKGDFNQSRIGKWLGDYRNQVEIAASMVLGLYP